MVEWAFDTRDAQAARKARIDFAERISGIFGASADIAAAELVLGELIGNAVRYAPGPALVKADFDEHGVTIAVQDSGSGFRAKSVDRGNDLLSESGRGLAIVSTLANSVEIECPGDDGCCVRARLEVVRVN